MLTPEEIDEIVDCVTYKPGWLIDVSYDRNGVPARPYLQVVVSSEAEAARNAHSGKVEPWNGAKHYLSPHMCRQEIVGKCYQAIQDAELHEMREWFRYRGASIYNPHLDPDALVPVARKLKNFSVRKNAMTLDERPPMYDIDRMNKEGPT